MHGAQLGTRAPNQSARQESTGPQRRSAPDSAVQSIVEQDASNRLAAKIRPVRLEPRFPDLKKKAVWKVKALIDSVPDSGALGNAGASIDRVSVGAPGSEQRIRSVDFAVVLGDLDKRRLPDFLRDAVDELAQLNGFEIELLTDSDEDGWTLPITALSNDDGEIDARLFVETADGMLRLRRASAFAVKNRQEHISVVVIESTPNYFKLYTTNGRRADEIYETLRCEAGDYAFSSTSDGSSLSELIVWVFDAMEN